MGFCDSPYLRTHRDFFNGSFVHSRNGMPEPSWTVAIMTHEQQLQHVLTGIFFVDSQLPAPWGNHLLYRWLPDRAVTLHHHEPRPCYIQNMTQVI